nr:uncharacterized protein LOC129441425 [Misgurnus anguillicaudatus]
MSSAQRHPPVLILDALIGSHTSALVSLTQVKEATGVCPVDCPITSITSPAASSLLVKWNSFTGATSYLLDARVVNSTSIAPVLVQISSSNTERVVQGLRPGQNYQVTLKVYQFYYVICISSQTGQTVPGTSQITFSKAISSTSIRFEWSNATGADKYILGIDKTFSPFDHLEYTFLTTSGQVNNLQQSTAYSCYVYSSNAAGLGAKSLVKTIRTLVQPPNGVNVVKLTDSTARVSWLSVSSVLLYQVTVSANNKSGIPPVSWNSTTLTFDIPNLVPCTTYTVGVSSISMFLEPGEPSNVTYTTPGILPVTVVSADYNCVTGTASVSWGAVFGATSYRAVATDDNGMTRNCTSTTTSCQVSMLSCGRQYTVRIVAIADCESTSGESYTFQTASCPPHGASVYRECSSNVIIYSWNATDNTAYYIAMAQGSDGETRECLTEGTSCYFTNMNCGKNYTFTVSSTFSGGLNCNSGNTEPVAVTTAPCLPQNVRTTADCSIGTAIATWDLVEGAKSYVVEARGNRRDFYNCSSQGNSCMLSDLDCGESLSVWIFAKNEYCTTDAVLGEVADTGECDNFYHSITIYRSTFYKSLLDVSLSAVPCPPQNVSAANTCSSTSASMTWLTSNGAVFYIAVATHSDGTVHTCISMATECEFQGLRCGGTYDAYVQATNMHCNSSESDHITLKTAPCAPANVGVVKDCGASQATVSWQTSQTGGLYTAVLKDALGPSLNCSTSTNSCTVPNMRCGAIYNVSVTYYNGQCNSLPSPAYQIPSVPCQPQNVTSTLQCETNTATVTWGAGAGATPCIPTNVIASLNCTNKTASVTWTGSLGATGYQVKAESSMGHRTSCNATSTQCDVTDLRCGQQYSITVVAKTIDCMGQSSQPVTLVSAPCPNTNVQARLDCQTNAALISWTPGNGTLRFNATLQSSRDLNQHSCTTNSSSCNISSLQCGERYNISVTGYGQTCSSCSTTSLSLDTAPCVPTQVNVSMTCQSDIASVSWTASAGLVLYYIATAESANGQTLTCNSSSTSCNLSGLMCGRAYNVSVTAVSANCTGQRSGVYLLNTAPCAPESVVSQLLDCQTGAVRISWQSSNGSLSYCAKAVSTAGNLTCNSTSTSCVIPAISCGQTYNITVAAQGNGCIAKSVTSQITAGPCPPSSVSAVLSDCSSNTALVSWTSIPGVQYTARANGTTGSSAGVQCNTTNSNCTLTNLQCGSQYNISVTATRNNCSSTANMMSNFTTAPCAPVLSDAVLNCSSRSANVTWSGSVLSGVVVSVSAVNTQGVQLGCGPLNGQSCVVDGLQCGQTYMFAANATQGQCTSTSNTLQRQTGNKSNLSHKHSFHSAWEEPGRSQKKKPDEWPGISQRKPQGGVTGGRSHGGEMGLDTLEKSDGDNSHVLGDQGGAKQTESPGEAEVEDWGLRRPLRCMTIRRIPAPTPQFWRCPLEDPPRTTAHGSRPERGVRNQHKKFFYVFLEGEISLASAPCAPQNVTANLNSSSNTATVTWGSSQGAVLYSVTASSVNGQSVNCTSASTSCVLSPLACGQQYTITMRAVGTNYSSEASAPVQIQTAPCQPQNVSANVNCSSNTATVTWGSSQGAMLYSVTASSVNGQSVNCTSASTSCVLSPLTCGQQYMVTMRAVGTNYSSEASAPVQIQSVPCTPQNVLPTVYCGLKALVVSWTPSAGGQNYTATLRDTSGLSTTCLSSGSQCNIIGLSCGQVYSVVVTASDNLCTSAPSSASTQSVPCAASSINATLDCVRGTATVSWQNGTGAQGYAVSALSSRGNRATCVSNSSITNCVLSSLQCGDVYTVTVQTLGQTCNASAQMTGSLITAPCAPESVVSQLLDCQTGAVRISWQSSNGSLSYCAKAVSTAGNLTCNSTSTSCVIPAISCGQTYNITVAAQGNGCIAKSVTSQITAGPCPPSSVSAVLSDCSSNTALVSWTSIPGVQYTARANGTAGSSSGVQCNTTNSNCTLTNLQCGSQYNISVTATRNNCSSTANMMSNFTTAPCAPVLSDAVLNCSSRSANVTWFGSASSGVVVSVSAVNAQGVQLGCGPLNGQSCVVDGLQCGQTYTFGMNATQGQCTSTSNTLQRQTAPCPPQNVSANVNSSSNTATVTWGSSQGAVLYSVTASSVNGQSVNCTSASTSCVLSPLACGQQYTVTMRAVGTNHSSETSAPVQIQTGGFLFEGEELIKNHTLESLGNEGKEGHRSLFCVIYPAPCPPQNVSANVNSSSNTATVTWGSSQGAVLYSVTASSVNGQSINCTSASTSCVLSPLACGQQYTITMRAVGTNYSSEASAPVQIQTAPCPPQNVSANVNCSSNTATVTWGSSQGAVLYSVTASSVNGQSVNCTSASTSCILSPLACGQQYTVTMRAVGTNYSSEASAPVQIQTAPCPPQNVSANVNSSSNTATVTWGSSQGAVLYSVTASSVNGQSVNCTSASTSCVLSPLACGQQYTVTMRAVGTNYSSEASAPVQIQTAPCTPQNVSANVNSSSNTATVTWGSSQGAVLYSVTASSVNGQSINCTSGSTSCVLSPLACGQQYTITMRAVGTNYSSEPSTPVQIQTGSFCVIYPAPCPPQNVSANVNCSSNTATVTWGSSQGAVLYSVTASSVNGQSVNCTSASTSCVLSPLTCGQRYTVTMRAVGTNYSSEASAPVQIQSVPCTPLNVLPTVDCGLNALVVSWTPSAGGQNYTATLRDTSGLSTTCQSSGSQCNITGLRCGQVYSVDVTASDNLCTSTPSTTANTQSVPCAASSINATLDCVRGTATVSWQNGTGAQGYAVSALSSRGNRATCVSNSSITNCALSSLQCGDTYAVTVQTLGQTCNASAQMTGSLITAPCAPESVVSQLLDCQTGALRISWQSSNGSLSYCAKAVSTAGNLTCNSTSTSCIIPAISCGQTYNITVAAQGNGCTAKSVTSQITAGPCPPSSVSAVLLDCSSNTALVSWTSIPGVQYTARANGTAGSSAGVQCNTTNSNCTLTNLQCGSQYNISVTATRNNCSSTANMMSNFTTAPCAPVLSDAVLNCSSLSANVTWSGSALSGVLVSVSAVNAQGVQLACGPLNGQSCVVDGLQCGQTYTFGVNATQGQCTSTSNTLQRQTAPYPPQNIQSITNISNNTVSVSWSSSNGTVSYRTTLECSNGQTYTCRTNTTGCDITNMPCGQTCAVKSVAEGTTCNSTIGIGPNITTASCAPQNVSANVNCSSNTATVTWGSSQGVVLYSVTASSVNGQSVNCTSASTSCVLSPLACGQRYTVTVRAVNTNYNSDASAPVQIQSVPCSPLNVLPTVDCGLNALVVSWTPSAGGQNYTATLRDTSGLSTTCQSSGSQCNITGLSCGQVYSVDVTASDNLCTSTPSSASTQSVPCAASSINATLDCVRGTATVSWQNGTGAQGYAVSALSSRGNRATCVSNSSITNCALSSLQCGDTYAVTVQTLGQTCNASAQMTGSLITAPCAPESVVSQLLDCQTGAVRISWQSSNGSLSYCAKAVSTAGNLTCNSTSTSCVIPAISCGQTYNITVAAQGNGCIAKSVTSQITAGPCPPSSVSAVLSDCSSNTALVSWTSIPGVQYTARANGTAGSSAGVQCNTTNSNCTLSNLQCGSQYNISVTATRNNCSSTANMMSNFTTAPCAPVLSDAVLNCSSRSANVTWSGSASSGVVFSVSAVNAQGVQLACGPLNGQSCVVDGLQCGQTYTFGVNATQGQCTSTSNTLQRQTAPYAPQNIQSKTNCGNNTVSVSWSSSNGTVSYRTTLECSNGQTYTCRTTATGCDITNMPCGQTCTVKSVAEGATCNSSIGIGPNMTTVPCVPAHVQGSVDCTSGNISLSWNQSVGAVSYTATAQGNGGYASVCNSTGPACVFSNLLCGMNYSFSVSASDGTCSTAPSQSILLTTVPCKPQNASAQLNCNTNTAVVTWEPSDRVLSYIVKASSPDGHQINCTSSNYSCTLPSMHCGQNYNVTVAALIGGCCNNKANFILPSAPCAPLMVNGTLDCVTNSAWVSWNLDNGTESYSVLAVSSDGQIRNCSTSNSSCKVADLGCSKIYNFSVTATTGSCQSPASSSFQLETGPCALSSIVAVTECQSSVIQVQWQRAPGGNSLYVATAEGQDRSIISCNSSTSSCNLTGVRCGMEYTIIVSASSNRCSSLRSPTYKISTVPCQPTPVDAHTDCQTNNVSVSWQPSYVAKKYTLTVVGRAGDVTRHCTADSNFTLSDLRCSDTYYLSVSASRDNCTSLPSTNITFNTVPCKPANLTLAVNCVNGSALLSWRQSTGAVSYTGLAQSTNGTAIQCQSTNTSCSLQGLVCGRIYNFTVQASDGICNSSVSDTLTRGAVPCPPAGLRVIPNPYTVVNETQILRASWLTGNCPNSEYLLQMKGGFLGDPQALYEVASYWTSRTFFEVPLPCGSSYNATIRAKNCAGSSVESSAVSGTTVPCAPVNVKYTQTTVEWSASIYATNYTVYQVNSTIRTQICVTSQLSCAVTNMGSGAIIVTARNSAGESQDSLPASLKL